MSSGSYRVAADGLAGPARAVRVNNIIVKSGSGGGAVVKVLNGTGGSEFDSILGTTSTGVVRNYEAGFVLPAGCYIDLDTNTDYVVVNLEVLGV